ncbi:MAG: phosphate ABC transporter permease PstA [Chloroflexota bacterium]|nr:MAG: phosphate ABC transporter permease PstA [Chloroflexota bacterium]
MAATTRPLTMPGLYRSHVSRRRRGFDIGMRWLSFGAAVLCVVPLAAVLIFVTVNGAAALNPDLITKPTRALGKGGGALGAILGTLQMVPVAALIAIPVGVAGGIYVGEFAGRRSARIVRFAADVMVGVPSILIGIFVFTFLVLPFKQYNALAGSVALAVIMIPVILRTTEEILQLVPGTLREASLALGIPMWRTVWSVVIRTGVGGILTGVMLAFARAMGETAPLLFTALGSRLVNVGDFGKPMDSLPVFIYVNARQPYELLNQQAWGAAFLLLLIVLVINVAVRARTWGGRIGA